MFLGYQEGKIKFYTEEPLQAELYNLDRVEETELEYILDGEEYVLKDEAWEEKQKQAERERIQELFMTRSDFFDGTIMAWGVDENMLQPLIIAMVNNLPLDDRLKLKALNNFKNALNFYRKHDLFNMLVNIPIQLTETIQVIITDESLDKFFDEVNKGNKDTAWEHLPKPILIPTEEDLQVEIEEELPANEIVETEGNANEEIG